MRVYGVSRQLAHSVLCASFFNLSSISAISAQPPRPTASGVTPFPAPSGCPVEAPVSARDQPCVGACTVRAPALGAEAVRCAQCENSARPLPPVQFAQHVKDPFHQCLLLFAFLYRFPFLSPRDDNQGLLSAAPTFHPFLPTADVCLIHLDPARQMVKWSRPGRTMARRDLCSQAQAVW
jgi:hypothetical protein